MKDTGLLNTDLGTTLVNLDHLYGPPQSEDFYLVTHCPHLRPRTPPPHERNVLPGERGRRGRQPRLQV